MFLSILTPLLLSTAAAQYAPRSAVCPTGPLLRPANGLSDNEEAYRVARKAEADIALKAWLKKTNPGFGTDELPTVALTSSGGGYRSLLLSAGVIQGFDNRDSNVSTSGLYQALTYQSGLSGGSWMLSSLAGNNYPTISYLRDNLWEDAFQASLLFPQYLLAAFAYGEITRDLRSKEQAGFDTTIVDAYGRLLSYQLFPRPYGVSTTLSSIATLSNFTSHSVPYPIITALGAKVWQGECAPGPNGTTYEFTPYEFGSWEKDVSAFTPTSYLGTSLENGVPKGTLCTKNYDNLGYVLGTSSNVFSTLCLDAPNPSNSSNDLSQTLAGLVDQIHEFKTSDLYAKYPNPFYSYQSPTGVANPSNNVSAQKILSLVDGGQALQNNPIFPFLRPERNISVIIVNDNSADQDNYPNGTEILTTYVQSFNQNLTRMPFIPSVETFLARGLYQKATFFGCGALDKVTIVYLPNRMYSYASNKSTGQLVYSKEETNSMIANGAEIANQGGEKGWGTCLGCGLMMKTGQILPAECGACFEKYCYYE